MKDCSREWGRDMKDCRRVGRDMKDCSRVGEGL